MPDIRYSARAHTFNDYGREVPAVFRMLLRIRHRACYGKGCIRHRENLGMHSGLRRSQASIRAATTCWHGKEGRSLSSGVAPYFTSKLSYNSKWVRRKLRAQPQHLLQATNATANEACVAAALVIFRHVCHQARKANLKDLNIQLLSHLLAMIFCIID